VLLGCAAGLVNVPRIKGNHNAMLSGISAAEAAAAAINAGREGDELNEYETTLRSGFIAADLKKVRNVKPIWSKWGLLASVSLGGLDMWMNDLFGLSLFGTLRHGKTDAESTGLAKDYTPIDYPKPDGKLSFDRLTNVAFSFTNHEEKQPCHLRLRDPTIPIVANLPKYAEPAQRYLRQASMRCSIAGVNCVSKLTSRTAFTAKPATLRTRHRISNGPRRKVEVALTIRICRRALSRMRVHRQSRQRCHSAQAFSRTR
jgi:hypothetical protein